jgi:hypothetical protein
MQVELIPADATARPMIGPGGLTCEQGPRAGPGGPQDFQGGRGRVSGGNVFWPRASQANRGPSGRTSIAGS